MLFEIKHIKEFYLPVKKIIEPMFTIDGIDLESN